MFVKEVRDFGTDLEDSNKAVVIGNGESRLSINLETYKLTHTLIGCNAIHRDISVTHLVCCDKRMVNEATSNRDILETKIYVRECHFHYFRKIKKNKNIIALPNLPYVGTTKKDNPDNWGSGCYAVLVAINLGFKQIELIGFDLYSTNNYTNNVYKGTEHYSKLTDRPIDPSYWVYQLSKIFSCFPEVTFIVKNHFNWKMPTEWQKDNVKFVAL